MQHDCFFLKSNKKKWQRPTQLISSHPVWMTLNYTYIFFVRLPKMYFWVYYRILVISSYVQWDEKGWNHCFRDNWSMTYSLLLTLLAILRIPWFVQTFLSLLLSSYIVSVSLCCSPYTIWPHINLKLNYTYKDLTSK